MFFGLKIDLEVAIYIFAVLDTNRVFDNDEIVRVNQVCIHLLVVGCNCSQWRESEESVY